MKATHSIGAFEAKTKLSELLERVQRGESFTITKHDRPVASLTSYSADSREKRKHSADRILEERGHYKLGGLDGKALREEGRK
ncbi:type II toxin-antitoxin system prevent-host-death family antitoxin [Puniceicoccales bacterium CK1056]|uniref:Antitoxin n=1 Tax=Oceanipulchritudo coccoides TaxID=2706888 RepID=A0A6B2M7K3_9BACT|nr:type II toxin-antitoxin system prevent-host-death family antitoxin [Oceanipulchritudo coccoides]NDV63580.1 type II toxin-antitoxin system prevent-host-death family antitoxin [Oceanipulchritudo coccoides]